MAATGAATENRELVLDEPPATVGENGRTARETRPLLLVTAGEESFDSATVCQHAGADRGVVATGRLESGGGREETQRRFQVGRGSVSRMQRN